MNYILIFAFGIGFVSGLRSMTAPAVVAWAARFGWLTLSSSPLAFMASKAALILFSIGAIGELIADKLPQTPNRTTLFPLSARIVFGGLSGACICASVGQSIAIGAMIGAIGGIVGAFGGYEVRRRLVGNVGLPAVVIALLEDVIAIGLALFLVSR